MAKQIHLRQDEIKKINKFINIIKQKGVKVSHVILFGSYAKGNANPDSDIDIVIVSPRFGEDIPKEMMFLKKMAIKVDSHIEPIPLSPKDLDDQYSTFIQEIKQYGKELAII